MYVLLCLFSDKTTLISVKPFILVIHPFFAKIFQKYHTRGNQKLPRLKL